jgi:branched-subunit amino acid ABC-type transport system permease component
MQSARAGTLRRLDARTGAYLAIEFKTTMAFVLIVGVLLVRPEGLLGRKFQERV